MVVVTTIGDENRSYWDREVAKLEMCHPLNAFGWGKVRHADDWIPTYWMAKRDGVVCGAAILLIKAIPFMPFSFLYMPKSPVCSLSDQETIFAILQQAKRIAKSKHAIFLRIDPNVPEVSISEGNDPFTAVGFKHLSQRWSYWNSPRDVVRVNLTNKATEKELFLSMKKDAQRGVKKAQKSGIQVRQAQNVQDLKTFHVLFKRFSEEKGFMSRGYLYQKSLWDEYLRLGNGVLFLAEYGGEIAGGILNLIFANKCVGMHGAVLMKYRGLHTNDLLEWEGLKWAKAHGCVWYSFRGIGPTHSNLRFKLKFGAEVIPLIGYYDFPFRPFLYRVVSWLEFNLLPRVSAPLTKLYHVCRRFF
jgi:peptidoglycan pentaglycine glycine transferase (the first glycine)